VCCSISAVDSANNIFQKVVAVLDKKLGKDSTEEGAVGDNDPSEWRSAAVVDIENRFSGSLKDQPEAQAA